MTWFQRLTGAVELSPTQVRDDLSVDGDSIVCPNGRRVAFGRLEVPKLSELRHAALDLAVAPLRSTIRQIVGDASALHADAGNTDALIQVASQFNLLEMTGPSVTPERGVGIYEFDRTQGPACAIACGAGTIYRNYFAPVGDSIGQSAEFQIDCSCDLGKRLGNDGGRLWTMRNGYLLPTDEGLKEISLKLQQSSEQELDELRGELRIGLQWQTDVTLPEANHKVSQAYCSALPVAYGRQPTEQWTHLAKLVLDAAYEATFCAAAINASRTGKSTVYLTLLGGGAFGNRDSWITAALARAFHMFSQHGLDVHIVSFGQFKPAVTKLIQQIDEQLIRS